MDTLRVEAALQAAKIEGVSKFMRRLQSNVAHEADFLAEAEAAIMFANSGFRVNLRDRPDLHLTGQCELINAEVKHFRYKMQDRLDDEAFSATDLLVPYGDTRETENCHAWQQIVDVACRKAQALDTGVANLLVIRSSSPHCVEDGDVLSACNEIEEKLKREHRCCLQRVSGLLLMSLSSTMKGQNVYYYPIRNATTVLSSAAEMAVTKVKRWNPLTTALS